jgi:hypothetical protein
MKHVDDREDTCIKALDGRAGRNGGGAGLLARTNRGVIRVVHGLDDHAESGAIDGDGEDTEKLALVLLVSTVRYCQHA